MRPWLPGQGLCSLGYIYDITMDSIHIYFRFFPTIPKSNIKIDIASTQIGDNCIVFEYVTLCDH
jgi:hypothetical protein